MFGAGFDRHMGRLHIKPELRYSRWISRAFSISPYLNSPNFGSGVNEVEFLLGIEVDRR